MQQPSEQTQPSHAALDPARWVDAHGDALFSFALLRLRDRALAEDVVQETFLAGLQAAGSFRGQCSERTWLIGILRHKIVDVLRRTGRDASTADVEATDELVGSLFDRRGHWRRHPGAWSADPALLFEQAEFWRVVAHCMAALPDRAGQAFSLRVMDGAQPQEVCKVLGITPTNLWVLLHRARTRLRQCLDTNWFNRRPEEGR